MATSPSEPVPPEVIAIAVALAVTMLEPDGGGDAATHRHGPPDVRPWRWAAWDS